MGGVKEVLFAHSFFAGEVDDLVGVGQHGTEKGPFGLEVVVREKAFNGDGGGGIPTDTRLKRLGVGDHGVLSLRMEPLGQSREESCWRIFWAKDG